MSRSSRPSRKFVFAAVAGIIAVGAVGAGGVAWAVRSGQTRADSRHEEPVTDVPRRDGNGIVISEAFRQSAGLETVPAAMAPLTPRLHLVGSVEFDPTYVAAVGTRAEGIVAKVLFVEGDFVKQGDVIAEIESAALAEVHAELRVAAAKRRAASLNAQRERGLLAQQLTTAREAEQAGSALDQQNALFHAAKERVEALGGGHRSDTGLSVLRAPIAGVVVQRLVHPGQSVGPGTVAFRVGDVDRLWTVLRAFERHGGLIHVGDEAEVRPLADPKLVIPGKVTHVGAVLDPTTRTLDVRVQVDNQTRVLRPGQSVKAVVRASGPEQTVLAVPTSAITYVDGRPTVFVAESATRFVPKKVELGIEGGEQVEVVKGVLEGEQVVSKNVLAIKSELFR